MKRKTIKKISAIISVFMTLLFVFNSSALAVNSQKDSFTLEDISIIRQCGVLEGEFIQLQATLSPSDAPLSGVEWSSSNPGVIECDKNGRIKGIQAGGYADITCKSKWNSVKDTIRVYCVKPLSQPIKSGFEDFLVSVYAQPSTQERLSTYVNFPSLLDILFAGFKVLLGMGATLPFSTNNALSMLTTGKCKVFGQSGKFCYVRFNDSVSSDGFVIYTTLTEKIPNSLYLNEDRIIVFSDKIARDDAILKTNYNGSITWSVSDDQKIKFDKTTGQVTGISPGVATITAKTADGMTQKCTVYSVYKWPQSWTVTPTTNIQFYDTPSLLDKAIVQPQGYSFYVVGDMGDDSNWCLVNHETEYLPFYDFAKIDDFSTKGTISQYRKFNWTWPVKTPENENKANFISSPYGKRDADPTMHKGFDITTGTQGEIKGYEVVSAFKGKVIYSKYGTTTGYCVGIQSDKADPISGKKMVAFYMHLNNAPDVGYGQLVSQGDTIGYVGNTGNSGGYHLHFETNNQNASIGDGSTAREYYAYLINPLFFFTNQNNNFILGTKADKLNNDDKIIIDKTCSTVVSHFGAYWYGDDREEK